MAILELINFEILHISKFSFSRKVRFSAESTPCYGALHFRAALERLHFFKVKMLLKLGDELPDATARPPVAVGQPGHTPTCASRRFRD